MLVGDVMAGLKGFVVKFMIRMSRVYQFFFVATVVIPFYFSGFFYIFS
jgi:hypothetical protein